jgi:hypothetical protein
LGNQKECLKIVNDYLAQEIKMGFREFICRRERRFCLEKRGENGRACEVV